MTSLPPEKGLLLRDLGLLLGLPILCIVGFIYWWSPWPDKFDVASPDRVFEQVAGTWHWVGYDTCGVSYHTITFDAPPTVMMLISFTPPTDSTPTTIDTTFYDIQGHGTHHVRGLIRGETRKSLLGEPVVWDLVLTSPDTYQWKQAGISGILGYSGVIQRCPTTSSPSASDSQTVPATAS